MLDAIKRGFDRLPVSREFRDIVNLPNTITMLRVTILPVLFLLLLQPNKLVSLIIAVLFALAALTDMLDGYIARRYKIVTKIGKLLDPIADKMIVSTAMVLMIPVGRIPAWIVAIIIIRDIAIDGIRHVASVGGLIISASRLGKYKTFTQEAAITALIIHYPLFGLDAHYVGLIILYVALALTVLSGVEYFFKFFKWAFKPSD